MKTMKIFAAVSLALIIGIAGAYSGNNPNAGNNNAGNTLIKYHVNIHITKDLAPGTIYMVQLVNARGEFVAPTQTYIPGKTHYAFFEPGNVRGIRIARLVIASNIDHFASLPTLYCKPDIKGGTFLGGENYFFDLYPMTVAPDKN
jgi:hypothetical protein